MKLKDLPPNTNVQSFRVKLPAKALKAFRAFGGGEATMYPVGYVMGAFMMSPQSSSEGRRSLYPMPPEVSTKEMLEWRVVK